MRVYQGTGNGVDVQVENGCGSLFFIVKKPKAGLTSLVKFFGDDNVNTADTLLARYCNRTKGQLSIIPQLPILPVAIAATTGPNHIVYTHDDAGLIDEVRFSVQVGVNGALTLDGNSYLSITTGFSNLTSLEIYAIDGIKTNLMYHYQVDHFNAKTQKDLSLSGVNQIIMSKQVSKLDMARGDGYMISLEQPEIADIARSLNDIMAVGGKPFNWNQSILGATVPVAGGIVADQVISGGTIYNVIGASDYFTAKIMADYDDRVYTTRAVDSNLL